MSVQQLTRTLLLRSLQQLTQTESDPLMAKTFNELQKKIVETKPHEVIPGRKSAYIIEEFIDKGRALLPTINDNTMEGDVDEDDSVEGVREAGDILIELV
jgi:hypothetical protein